MVGSGGGASRPHWRNALCCLDAGATRSRTARGLHHRSADAAATDLPHGGREHAGFEPEDARAGTAGAVTARTGVGARRSHVAAVAAPARDRTVHCSGSNAPSVTTETRPSRGGETKEEATMNLRAIVCSVLLVSGLGSAAW